MEKNVGVKPLQSPRVDDGSEDTGGGLLHREGHTAGGDWNLSAEWTGGRALTQYVAECEAYAKAAGIADEADVGNASGTSRRTSRRQELGLGP